RAYAVGAAANRDCQTTAFEFSVFPVMGRQNWHLAENKRQFPVFGLAEVEPDSQGTLNRDTFHICVVISVKRMTFGGQKAIGKFNVFGSNGLAILKTGLLPQIENDVASVVRNLDAFSNQSVLGKRLVIRGHHQGVVDVGIDARSGYTPYDVRVKTVKTVGHHTQV